MSPGIRRTSVNATMVTPNSVGMARRRRLAKYLITLPRASSRVGSGQGHVLEPRPPAGEALDVALDAIANRLDERAVVEDEQRRIVDEHLVDLSGQIAALVAA